MYCYFRNNAERVLFHGATMLHRHVSTVAQNGSREYGSVLHSLEKKKKPLVFLSNLFFGLFFGVIISVFLSNFLPPVFLSNYFFLFFGVIIFPPE